MKDLNQIGGRGSENSTKKTHKKCFVCKVLNPPKDPTRMQPLWR